MVISERTPSVASHTGFTLGTPIALQIRIIERGFALGSPAASQIRIGIRIRIRISERGFALGSPTASQIRIRNSETASRISIRAITRAKDRTRARARTF